MKWREMNRVGYIPFAAGEVKTLDLPKDGFARFLRLAVRGDWTYDYTSTAPTLATTPPGSLAFLSQIKLTRNPESFAGPLVLDTIPAWLLHLAAIPFTRRMPKALNPALSTADADFSTYCELFIPLSLLDGMDSALPVAGRSEWKLSIKWPSLAAAAIALVGPTTVATVADDNTERIRVEVTLGDIVPEPGDTVLPPAMEIGMYYDRVTHDTSNINKPLSPVPGEVPLIVIAQNVDNAIFAAVPGSPDCRIRLGRGALEPEFEFLPDELRRKNEADYGIRDGDGYAYAYFFDFMRLYRGVERIPEIANQGGALSLGLRSSTATGTSYIDVLSVVGRWRPGAKGAKAKVS